MTTGKNIPSQQLVCTLIPDVFLVMAFHFAMNRKLQGAAFLSFLVVFVLFSSQVELSEISRSKDHSDARLKG